MNYFSSHNLLKLDKILILVLIIFKIQVFGDNSMNVILFIKLLFRVLICINQCTKYLNFNNFDNDLQFQ